MVQTTPLKTGQSAPENSKCNGQRSVTQQVPHEQAKSTTAKQSTGSKSQARPQAEQTKRVNEPNAKKIDVQAKQPSKLSTKKTQKSTSAVKKTVAPPPQPMPSKIVEPKVASKKVLSCESTSAKPTTCTKSKSATTAPPVNNKKSTVKKSRYQIPDSPDPYDIPSPVLDYTEENCTTAAAPMKQHNTSLSSVSGVGGGRQSVNSTSKSTLSDITNQSHRATQLNRGGQHRVFNLSAAPQRKGGKNGRGKNGRNSASSSLSNSPCLADDVNAIPDSMPVCGQISEKSLAYTSFLDDELELRPPTTTTSKQRKRVRVPTDSNSFAFDSDNESDLSWKVSGKTKKGKIATTSKPPPAKNRQYKAKATREKPKPMLTSARTKKVATDKKEQSVKAIAKSKATTSTTKVAKKPDEDTVKKTTRRPPAGTTLLGRKRAIDDVYDPDFTPEFNRPKPKVTAAAAAPAAKKALPKKKAAPSSTLAANTVEEPARETPSLPSMKKDAAARKLVMIQDSPKQNGARKRVEVAKEAGGKKKQPPTTRNGKKKQSTLMVDAPCAHDDLYYSPAIPRVSASKPDLAERAQSHNKPRSLKQPPAELDLHGDDALICPPLPKKPRVNQRAGRRSSGYFSDTHSHAPTSPPGYSDLDDSLIELQDNVKTNLQFVEDGREHSSCSSSPSISCPLSPPPPPRRQPPNSKLPSLPASPTSMHSSQVEADLNITANFEEICRQFISRSGKAKTGQPSATTAAEVRKQAVKGTKPSENVATAAKKRREQRNHWDNEDEGRHSPPPRKVVKVSTFQCVGMRLSCYIFCIDSAAAATATIKDTSYM